MESVCLPLAADEYALLESQLIRDGCLDALKVWDRDGEQVLLDGHNRLAICKKHNILYDTSTIDIDNIDVAVIWIVDNQRGRRNVATEEHVEYISGKRYNAQKNINRQRDGKGVFKADAPSRDFAEMGDLPPNRNFLAYKHAKEEGITPDKVERNAAFARGVDAVREVSPELADKILKPVPDGPKLTKSAVVSFPKMKAKDPEKFAETVNKIEEALETNDKDVVKAAVHDCIHPGEPTKSEKIVAAKRHLKPEHVQYANVYGIPIENLPTIEQLAEVKPRELCSLWDGFYGCECGIKFEMFGATQAPVCCPQCRSENPKRC